MSRAAAIGEDVRLAGYALAGVEVLAAEDRPAAVRAWEELPDDVGLLLLTPLTDEALAERFVERPELLRARLP